jgi:hypothetical protein
LQTNNYHSLSYNHNHELPLYRPDSPEHQGAFNLQLIQLLFWFVQLFNQHNNPIHLNSCKQTTTTHSLTTITMSSPYTVQIHQSTKEPSISSSYSYSSDKHTTQVAKSGRNLVINHNKVSYEKDSPAPTYAGAYTRTWATIHTFNISLVLLNWTAIYNGYGIEHGLAFFSSLSLSILKVMKQSY